MPATPQHVLVIGGGLHGLCTAMLLARDGRRVTVLERDPATPPRPELAWDSWERRGVGQFRLPHYLLARFRQLLEVELPDVAGALAAAGALRFDVVAALPAQVTGGRRDGDDRYVVLTARRPVLEAVVARAAAAEPGVEVRRGVAVRALLTGRPDHPDVPHVTGVVTGDGEVVRADLVVDAGGRRSTLPALLAGAGAHAPVEEREDCGFVYYGRHFRGSGGMPPLRGPVNQQYESVSLLTLPADNDTWSVTLITSARDRELRTLRDPQRWTAALRLFPLAAPWLDAEPISEVAVMAGIEDRIRRFVVGGQPVATGVLAVGDAWACTNPTVGRGASMGLLHAVLLRELLHGADGQQPAELATRFAEATAALLEPWYRATVLADRHRLAEIEADRAGVPYEPEDPRWAMSTALAAGARRDPEVLRALLDIVSMLTLPADVCTRPGMAQRVLAAGADAPRYTLPGPDRTALLAAAGAASVPAAP